MSSIFYSEIFSILSSLMIATIIFSFVFSVILMISSQGLFFKLEKSPSSALIPVYNLFVLNEGLGINPMFTILYFVPFINLGFYVYICYKVGYLFKQNYDFTLGLVFFPYIFYYLLSNSKSQLSRYEEEKQQEANNEVLNDMLLVTDEKLQAINNEETPVEPQVDSIFKSHVEQIAQAPTYKASIKDPTKGFDFDAIDGKHKIIFIPSPRTSKAPEEIIKKVETTYIDKVNSRHEDEIGIYEIK